MYVCNVEFIEDIFDKQCAYNTHKKAISTDMNCIPYLQ